MNIPAETLLNELDNWADKVLAEDDAAFSANVLARGIELVQLKQVNVVGKLQIELHEKQKALHEHQELLSKISGKSAPAPRTTARKKVARSAPEFDAEGYRLNKDGTRRKTRKDLNKARRTVETESVELPEPENDAEHFGGIQDDSNEDAAE
jgi:hypothetical protein